MKDDDSVNFNPVAMSNHTKQKITETNQSQEIDQMDALMTERLPRLIQKQSSTGANAISTPRLGTELRGIGSTRASKASKNLHRAELDPKNQILEAKDP